MSAAPSPYDPLAIRTYEDAASPSPLRRLRGWWNRWQQRRERTRRAVAEARARADLARAEALRAELFGNRAARRARANGSKTGELAMRAERRGVRIAKRKQARGYDRQHVRRRELAAIAAMAPPAVVTPTSFERVLGKVRWWWGTRWIADLARDARP
jgi:hypothetical protein